MLDNQLANKEVLLRNYIRKLNSAALAFSGGVDSALVAYIASQELGDNFCAVTLRSPLISKEDLTECVLFCQTYKIPHQILDMDILAYPSFAANDVNRCYYCKETIFTALHVHADQYGMEHVMDGTNIEDDPARRPGMRVLHEQGIRSPLRANNLGKADIRALSKKLGLFTWDKESGACLATHIPINVAITAQSLRAVCEKELQAQ